MLEMVNKTKQKVCRQKARRLADGVLNFYNLGDREVSLVVIGDKKMQSLNRDFRGIDKTTDVLSFVSAQKDSELLGEVFINIDEANRTEKYKEMFNSRRSRVYIFYFLLTHGLLHLVGYDDKKEKDRQAMIALGEKFMDRFFLQKVI